MTRYPKEEVEDKRGRKRERGREHGETESGGEEGGARGISGRRGNDTVGNNSK